MKRKYWLWGGFLSIGILLGIMLLSAVWAGILGGSSISRILIQVAIFVLGYLDFLSLVLCKGVCEGENGMAHIITIFPSFFIIGAVLGWGYSKIKN